MGPDEAAPTWPGRRRPPARGDAASGEWSHLGGHISPRGNRDGSDGDGGLGCGIFGLRRCGHEPGPFRGHDCLPWTLWAGDGDAGRLGGADHPLYGSERVLDGMGPMRAGPRSQVASRWVENPARGRRDADAHALRPPRTRMVHRGRHRWRRAALRWKGLAAPEPGQLGLALGVALGFGGGPPPGGPTVSVPVIWAGWKTQ
jgi:hypothetical protein